MNAVILKFPLFQMKQTNEVVMPLGAEILCVQEQRGYITIWAKCHPNVKTEVRHIEVHGTGNEFDDKGLRYVGTVQQDGFVWHIFERK